MTDSFQKISMNVHLGGRMYPLTVPSSQEELVRIIAREINERIGQLQLQEDHKDKQDCIAIAAMSWAIDFAIQQQSELEAKKEIVTELTAENERFATENDTYKTQIATLSAKNTQHSNNDISLNNKLKELHQILDAALQK